MKKIVLSLLLIGLLLFSGCSCSSAQTLNFSTNWLNNFSSYTREYDVNFNSNVSCGETTYKNEKPSVYGDIEMNGNMTISLKPVSVDSLSSLFDTQYAKSFKDSVIFEYKTDLQLSVKYKKCGEETFNDYITTYSYFNMSLRLEPIYTRTESSTSYLKNDNGLKVETVKAVDETIYSGSSFTVKREFENITTEKSTTTKTTSKYTEGTVIDNGYLLFAIENSKIEKKAANVIKTVNVYYEEPKNLMVARSENDETLTVNETQFEKVKREYFALQNESSNCFGGSVGRPQFVYLIDDEYSNNLKVLRYVSPLTSYDSNYACLGALVYDLK